VRRFGFGRTTGSGFPGEVAGSLREIREKQAIERANLSFGQGVTADLSSSSRRWRVRE
jgi:cell division protein FtsI (penicillin-binding protein 3)